MTNVALLRDVINRRGMTVTAVANMAGMSRETLYNRFNVSSDFKASEIISLSNVLNLTEQERNEIFFAE